MKITTIKKIILILLTISLIYGIIFYFDFFQDKLLVKKDKIYFSNLPDYSFTSTYTPAYNFSKLPTSEILDVNLSVFENTLYNTSILKKSQRYYVPLSTICCELNYSLSKDSNNYVVYNNEHRYTFDDSVCNIDGTSYTLRGNLINYNNCIYISISDIEYIFNLTAIFDSNKKTIFLLNSLFDKDTLIPKAIDGRAALIRLEDFSADNNMLDTSTQVKFKIIANFLRTNSINYHIAWVPRFKNPSENIDNDLLKNDTFENAAFINLLDYLINANAEIGLHGYTHQHDNETSLAGTELSRNINNSEEATRQVVESAIDTAVALNIPYSFFESSHYKATSQEKKIISQYVQFLYEPMNYFIYTKLQRDGNNLYIPTPLSYVKDLDTSYILRHLKNSRPHELQSLFYHPSKELDFINYSINSNSINYTYSTESPLQKIVHSLINNNYVTIHVSDLHK